MSSADFVSRSDYGRSFRQNIHTTHREQRDDRCQGPNVGYQERMVSSVAGALLAAYGLSSSRRGSLLTAAVGGALLQRGMTGHCYGYQALGINTAKPQPATVIPAKLGCHVERSIVVKRHPAELYSFWRELENLPRIMKHLKSVEAQDRVRSHWVADGPLGKNVEWDAEIFNDVENELIAWRSIPGGDVDTAGSVRFEPIGAGQGARVTVNLKYDPPAGKIGAWVASFLGHDAETMVAEDLGRFKLLVETGATTRAAAHPKPM